MSKSELITRQILWNVPPWLEITFYAFTFTACGIALLLFICRIAKYRQSKRPDNGPSPSPHSILSQEGRKVLQPRARPVLAAIGSVTSYLAFHEQLRRDRYAGVAHILMFYGFSILFIGTCLVFLEHDTPLHFLYGRFYLVSSLIIDLGGMAFIAGLLIFLVRRLKRDSSRLLKQWWVGSLVLLLLLIALTGFLVEGARIAWKMPNFEKWSVVGYTIAAGLRALNIKDGNALVLHRIMWITHAIFCVIFFALLPWRFFGHIVYGAASWATRTPRPRGTLRLAGREPGAVTWRDLEWRDLLQADACTTCGRCNDVCPAQAAGKPLKPREVVLGLRDAMNDGRGVLTTFIPDEAIWSCTTCGACNDACPVGIEVYDKIIEMRRGRVEIGEVPHIVEEVFESTSDRSNPLNRPNHERMNWAAGHDVPVAKENEPIELLYWVGCAGSFDPDGRTVAQSMIKILNHLKLNYHVLGPRESCTGDPARRLGEDGPVPGRPQRAGEAGSQRIQAEPARRADREPADRKVTSGTCLCLDLSDDAEPHRPRCE